MSDETGVVADFLVSFKESDRPWAERICAALCGAGYRAELLSWAYQSSRSKLAEVERLGQDGAVFVPLLGPAYMTTLHSEHYWFDAFRNGAFPVLPVLIRDCDFGALLFVHEYVDFRNVPVEEGCLRLLAMARQLKGPRTIQTPTPTARPKAGPQTRMDDLAAVRRVPFERATPFAGSRPLLENLHSVLQSGGIAVLLSHESGLNGYGRRKTCIEYLYEYEREYKLIWVVRAYHEALLAEDMARIAEVAKLPEAQSGELPYVVHAVRRWLSVNKGWLLLFHDPPSYGAIARYLPGGHDGHVLISANSGAWPEARAVFHVARWADAQVDALASALLGSVMQEQHRALAAAAHGYPAAIVMACAVAAAQGWSAERLTQELEARMAALEPAMPGALPQSRALAAALSLGISHVWAHAPDAIELLRAMAYLDAYNILPGILVTGADSLEGSIKKLLQDGAAVEGAIGALKQCGIIEERMGSITIHPLVQAQWRSWMEQPPGSAIQEIHPKLSKARSFSLARAEGPLWCRRVLRMLLVLFPAKEELERKWRQAAKLASHVYAALEQAARLEVAETEQVELLARLGEYLLYRDLLQPAVEALERARTADTNAGTDNTRRLRILKALGHALSYQGNWHAAHVYLKDALDLAEKMHGRSSGTFTECLVLQGNVHRHEGHHEQAVKIYEQALEIDKALHNGAAHDDLMRDCMLLGVAREEAGDLSGAWSILEAALRMQRELHGPQHISLAQVSKSLGRVFLAMGDLPQAHNCFRQAIEVTLRVHGTGHPSLADIYQEEGEVLMQLRDAAGARKAFKEAYKILEAVHSADDIPLVDCAIRIGDSAIALGEAAKAVPAYERAAELLRPHLPQQTARMQRVQQRLAQARDANGHVPAAIAATERAGH